MKNIKIKLHTLIVIALAVSIAGCGKFITREHYKDLYLSESEAINSLRGVDVLRGSWGGNRTI